MRRDGSDCFENNQDLVPHTEAALLWIFEIKIIVITPNVEQ